MGKDGLPYRVSLMEAAMPPALSTSILALQYDLDEELAITGIGIGTMVCLAVVTAFNLFW